MKGLVTQVSLKLLGPPTEPCKCGFGEWEKHPTLNGYKCSACGAMSIGEVEQTKVERVEVEVTVERTPDGGAILHFGDAPCLACGGTGTLGLGPDALTCEACGGEGH